MRCEAYSRSKGLCQNEAVGRASDVYGGQNLCAAHLEPLKTCREIKITYFATLGKNSSKGESK
jgi:hypothetical protein